MQVLQAFNPSVSGQQTMPCLLVAMSCISALVQAPAPSCIPLPLTQNANVFGALKWEKAER